MPDTWTDHYTFARLAHGARVATILDSDKGFGSAARALMLPKVLLAQRPGKPIDEATDEASIELAQEAVSWFRLVSSPYGQQIHYVARDGSPRTIRLNQPGLTAVVRASLWMGVLDVPAARIRQSISSYLQITGQLSDRTVRHWRVAALRRITEALNRDKVPVRMPSASA